MTVRIYTPTFFSYTSFHSIPAKNLCCMISLASSGPPPNLEVTRQTEFKRHH